MFLGTHVSFYSEFEKSSSRFPVRISSLPLFLRLERPQGTSLPFPQRRPIQNFFVQPVFAYSLGLAIHTRRLFCTSLIKLVSILMDDSFSYRFISCTDPLPLALWQASQLVKYNQELYYILSYNILVIHYLLIL